MVTQKRIVIGCFLIGGALLLFMMVSRAICHASDASWDMPWQTGFCPMAIQEWFFLSGFFVACAILVGGGLLAIIGER
jgi:hypothetical protein